jgi:hypothetical protein
VEAAASAAEAAAMEAATTSTTEPTAAMEAATATAEMRGGRRGNVRLLDVRLFHALFRHRG